MASGPLAEYVRTRDAEAFAEVVTQYQSLVFATCRRQLRNPADVEDAVQETFLRLAQKASQLHTNLGAWLHTCAVNVSIDINRRRQSRARHESAAANATAKDDPDRALADLREHLDVALQKLSESQRELIIERFFKGTSQVDLAARAGVSPSTMSHHLDRAIEALRGHLKAMGCVGVTGSAAVLLEALQAEHSSATVGQALTANLMKIGLSGVGAGASVSVAGWLIGVAALLLVAIGGWIVWRQLTGPASLVMLVQTPTPAATQSSTTLPSPAAITVGAQQTGATMPPDWKTAQANTRSGVLAGRVVDEGGKPVAGALVVLRGMGGTRTTTDADGYYSFRALPQGNGEYFVAVRADGYMPIQADQFEQPPLQLSASSQARRDFVVHRAATVNLLITDAQNQPLQRVDIETTKLGADRFNARMMLQRPGPIDKTGRTTLTLPVGQGACCIRALLKGYGPERVIVNPTSADVPLAVHIVMQPGLNIRGVAICSDQKPAAGYTISARPDWSNGGVIMEEKIQSDGSFTLRSVGPGDYALTVWRQNTGSPAILAHFPPATQPIRLDLPFPSQASLVTETGRIHIHGEIPADVPLMWLMARAIPDSGNDDSAQVDVDVPESGRSRLRRSANEGTYTINALPGTYRIVFDSANIKRVRLENVHLPGPLPDVTIEMAGEPHLTGVVMDAATGKAVTHFAVRIRKVDNPGGGGYVQDDQWTQVSNRSGRFDVVCVDAGTYAAEVSAPGYAWTWSSPVSVDGTKAAEDAQVRLTAGGSLTGTVLDSAGKPVAGAKVIPLSMAMGLRGRYESEFETEAGAVLTDSSGHFVLPHLLSGSETLKISGPDYSPLIVPDLGVVEGKSTAVPAITLGQGGSIAGTVYDSLGKPLANVAVNFERSSDAGWPGETTGRIASTITDQNGHYHIDHLATQAIWVNLQDLWQRQGVVRRVIRPIDGKTAHLDFGGGNPIRGRLISGGKPVPNCRLQLSNAFGNISSGDVVALTSTDSEGKFTFFGPPPGRYKLYVTAETDNSYPRILRDVEVTDQPLDLGDIGYDFGNVIIKMAYDDPSIASGHFAWVAPGFSGYIARPFISVRATEEGDHLDATGIGVGHFFVTDTIGDSSTQYAEPFDRRPGDSQTAVVLHIPKATARVKLIDSSPTKDQAKPRFLQIRNEEGTIQAWVGTSDEDRLIPPGVYHILDPFLRQPRGDCPAIILRAGETTEIKEDLSQLDVSGDVGAAISIWTADGVLDTSSTVRLLDRGGRTIQPAGIADFATVFVAPAGHYRAEVSRPGQTMVVKDVELPPSSAAGPMKRVVQVYLTLP